MDKKSFEVEASPLLMKRLERFLALLHYNSSFGHSALFAMPLDGCGSDKIKIKGLDKNLRHEVDAIGGVGFNVEIAYDDSYGGRDLQKKVNRWYTGPAANLYRNGEVKKTIPSKDHDYPEGDTDG